MPTQPDPPEYQPEATWEQASLAAALAGVQAELPIIERNAKGQSGSREHHYADLAAVSRIVLPLLGKHGLAFTTRPTVNPAGQFVLAYSLLHHSGERIDGEYPLPTGTPQQLGSAITYGRRYCLCAVTGAAPAGEDDDGQAGGEAKQPTRQRRTRAESNGHGNPEDQPGSANDSQLRSIAMTYQKLGFERSERDEMLSASEQIVARGLEQGPHQRSHKNLSHNEARKLREALGQFTERGDLLAALVEAATP